MKVKDLIEKLSKLNPDDDLFCFTDSGDRFNDGKRAFEILDLQVRKGYRESLQTKNVHRTFTTDDVHGDDTAILIITSDF